MMGGRRKRARSEDDDAMTVCVHESKGGGHASLPAGIEEEDVLRIMHEVVQDFATTDPSCIMLTRGELVEILRRAQP